MTDRQEYMTYIKSKYPVGYTFLPYACNQLYTITKRTVFKIIPWKPEDYNDESRPKKDEDYDVDFYCGDPGKYTRRYSLCSAPKRWLLKRYRDAFMLKVEEHQEQIRKRKERKKKNKIKREKI